MTLTTLFPQCQDLQTQVEAVLQLLQQEPTLRSQQDGSVVQSSLRKAIAKILKPIKTAIALSTSRPRYLISTSDLINDWLICIF